MKPIVIARPKAVVIHEMASRFVASRLAVRHDVYFFL